MGGLPGSRWGAEGGGQHPAPCEDVGPSPGAPQRSVGGGCAALPAEMDSAAPHTSAGLS